MATQKSREGRLARIEEKLSRRDFGRRAVLLSVASGIAARSVPAFAVGVPFPDLKNPSTGVGLPCWNFLDKLGPDYTMYDLLFDDFRKVVVKVKSGYQVLGATRQRLITVNRHLDMIEDRTNGFKPTLAHLCSYEGSPDTTKVSHQEWQDIATKCRRVKDDLSLPFAYLSSSERIPLKRLLIDDPEFKNTFSAMRRFPYRDLFTRGRSILFPDHAVQGSDDERRYHLVRQAFELGAFRHPTLAHELEQYAMDGNYADVPKYKVSPNGRCWVETARDCCVVADKYCQEDPETNGPTTASDTCVSGDC